MAPAALVAPLAELRQLVGWCSPTLVARALAGLVAGGALDRHILRTRRAYRVRHQLVVDWLAGPGRRLGRLVPSDAGLHLAVELDCDEAALVARARERGLAVEGLARYALRPSAPALGLGYGTAPPEILRQALPLLLSLALKR